MSIPGPLTWLRAARDNQARLEADPRDIFLGQ